MAGYVLHLSTEENIKTAAAETARHIQRYCK